MYLSDPNYVLQWEICAPYQFKDKFQPVIDSESEFSWVSSASILIMQQINYTLSLQCLSLSQAWMQISCIRGAAPSGGKLQQSALALLCLISRCSAGNCRFESLRPHSNSLQFMCSKERGRICNVNSTHHGVNGFDDEGRLIPHVEYLR